MSAIRLPLVPLILAVLTGTGLSAQQPSQDPEGPRLFGAGLFSTGAWDFFVALSPNQRRALFCVANDNFTEYYMRESTRDANGHWRPARIPSFAWKGSDADPHFSPDGRRVFFVSDRPESGDSAASPDIWTVALGADGAWGRPTRLPAPINLPESEEWSPSVAGNGDLYFGSSRDGGRGGFDLYIARWRDGRYQAPENLGDSINTSADEVEPWIAPDQSYLILSARGRPDSTGRYDLYLAKRVNGVWQRPRPIRQVNTAAMELNHSVSPDGKWLFFSSTRRFNGPLGERFDRPRNDALVRGIGDGKGDIYRLPMAEVLGGDGELVSPRVDSRFDLLGIAHPSGFATSPIAPAPPPLVGAADSHVATPRSSRMIQLSQHPRGPHELTRDHASGSGGPVAATPFRYDKVASQGGIPRIVFAGPCHSIAWLRSS